MPKYKVVFRTEVMVDGWSDPRDREFEARKEQVTVTAQNRKDAQRAAIRQARGYHEPSYYGFGCTRQWEPYHIKSLERVTRKKVRREGSPARQKKAKGNR